MTENEWLTSDEPNLLKDYWASLHPGRHFFLRDVSTRKLRLLACACMRRIWEFLPDERSRNAIIVTERFVDGIALYAELEAAGLAARQAREDVRRNLRSYDEKWYLYECTNDAALAADISFAGLVISGRRLGPNNSRMRTHNDLVREVFGNPFRPLALNFIWLSRHNGAVERTARQIYEQRSFGDLPGLADDLEKAGCGNDAMLSHCRQSEPHVPGCWLLDLLLRKP